MFGGLATIPLFLIFATVRERFADQAEKDREVPFRQSARTAWSNIPFRFATLLYMLNWITFDLVGLMLPFFLTYWIAQGNLTAKVNILGEPFTLESAVLGLLLITAIVAVPFWTWLARKLDKRRAYIIGMSFWVVVQLLIFSTQPQNVEVILLLGVLAGLSVSTAHVLPDAIFPDVIEWDELRTGRRQEGIYYGIKNFVRKLTGAFAIFFALQVLGWFGYQAPPDGVTQFAQSAATQQAIRYLTGPIGAFMLIGAITVAYFYPLTRERHERILRLLEKRRARESFTLTLTLSHGEGTRAPSPVGTQGGMRLQQDQSQPHDDQQHLHHFAEHVGVDAPIEFEAEEDAEDDRGQGDQIVAPHDRFEVARQAVIDQYERIVDKKKACRLLRNSSGSQRRQLP